MTNDWIEWNGGECPVDGETLVCIKCKKFRTHIAYPAKTLNWKHKRPNSETNIIAYRLSKEQA